jgi:transposase-like protein
MTDWFERIAGIISSPEEQMPTMVKKNDEITLTFDKSREQSPSSLFSFSQPIVRRDPTFSAVAIRQPPIQKQTATIAKPVHREETSMTPEDEKDENLKALKRLRELPRGANVESRIAGIKNLLGEMEVFKTLKMLRWPQGVVCPRCHSSNVVRRDPPVTAADQRHYYVCLNCKGDGNPSDFDDFTGLPIASLHALRQWIMCWYLLGFCSLHQIAKVLGVSLSEVLQMATLGSELTVVPGMDAETALQRTYQTKEKKLEETRKRSEVDQQQDRTSSISKDPFKPGPKSKF